MLGFTIIRTTRLNGLLDTEKHFDGTLSRHRDQIAGLRESLKDTIASRNALEGRLTQTMIDLSVANRELAHWRANGQLRDPKTGRLIPKDKAKDAA